MINITCNVKKEAPEKQLRNNINVPNNTSYFDKLTRRGWPFSTEHALGLNDYKFCLPVCPMCNGEWRDDKLTRKWWGEKYQ